MMLAQVENQTCAGNLHVKRKIVAKPMLEIELETEEPEIKFFGLRLVEDPEDGRRLCECDRSSRRRLADFRRQHVPVFEAELCGYNFERLAVGDCDLLPCKSGLEGLGHDLGIEKST